jgi:hypothetical protein
MTATMTTGHGGTRWAVRLSVARRGGPLSWGAASGDFERGLARQASKTVIDPRIWSESRRGREHVRVTVTMTVIAADVAEAATAAWWVFRKAAASERGWDLVTVSAEISYAGQ